MKKKEEQKEKLVGTGRLSIAEGERMEDEIFQELKKIDELLEEKEYGNDINTMCEEMQNKYSGSNEKCVRNKKLKRKAQMTYRTG